uniref:Uncharacterized protein n=1 Tax=Anopheles atroparvus TaxID=41427 RepID=A0A182J9T0_ANOAO
MTVLLTTPPVAGDRTPITKMKIEKKRPNLCLRSVTNAITAAHVCRKMDEKSAHRKMWYHMSTKVFSVDVPTPRRPITFAIVSNPVSPPALPFNIAGVPTSTTDRFLLLAASCKCATGGRHKRCLPKLTIFLDRFSRRKASHVGVDRRSRICRTSRALLPAATVPLLSSSKCPAEADAIDVCVADEDPDDDGEPNSDEGFDWMEADADCGKGVNGVRPLWSGTVADNGTMVTTRAAAVATSTAGDNGRSR